MKKESLYLDTSVPSAYYDDRVKERQEAIKKFWNFEHLVNVRTRKRVNSLNILEGFKEED